MYDGGFDSPVQVPVPVPVPSAGFGCHSSPSVLASHSSLRITVASLPSLLRPTVPAWSVSSTCNPSTAPCADPSVLLRASMQPSKDEIQREVENLRDIR